MNVTELARRLKTNTKQMLEILPEYGYDIGARAVKVDDRVAFKIIRDWRRIKKDIDEKKRKEAEERKEKEKELRQESGQTISLPEKLTVKEFSEKLEMPVTSLMTELMKNGILANQNQFLDYDTAAVMAEEFGFGVERSGTEEESPEDEKKETALEEALDRGENLEKRSPVVVVMGHVDHGKTTLLDSIREANITQTESGGITQHIGAYQTIWKDPKTKEERPITFIDTPGHEAFTVMRSRGAKVADIAILIVAADDGVKPQTKEVIQIIKAAKLPYVVAINKVDKDGADPQRVKTELSGFDVLSEEWGGDISMVEVSAKKNLHIDKLLDVLLLMADINEKDIQADPTVPAAGTVIESNVDKGMGPVATILVQSGTLHKGDSLVVNGEIYGKVRAMKNYLGENIEEAGPSVPVQIIGFKVAPEVGDILDVAKEGTSKKIDLRQKRTQQTGAEKQTVREAQSEGDEEGEGKRSLNLLIKADVLGSLEAIIGSLENMRHEEVGIKIIGKGLGNINEADVAKAQAGNATVIGFHVTPTPIAEESMRENSVPFQKYEVIYDLINWSKEELQKLLSTETVITELGRIKVLAIFRSDKKAMTVGGRVEDGKVLKNSLVRVKRKGQIVGEGTLSELQTGKQSTNQVASGTECGVRFEGKTVIEEGDILEVYSQEDKERTLTLDKNA